MSGLKFGSRRPQLGCLAVAAVAGCAATTGVTLRSNHYRVAVPPGWQVVEAGWNAEIPALIRVPAGAATPAVEMRLYPWLVEGPIADAAGDAFQRLAAAGVLGLAAAKADDDQLCPNRIGEAFVFGNRARVIHVQTSAGQRIAITAGHAYGSLVAVVAITASRGSACAETETMDLAIKRLASSLAAIDAVSVDL